MDLFFGQVKIFKVLRTVAAHRTSFVAVRYGHFGASLVAQLVKDQPAMWETWVQSLGWEDPPEEGMATHSSILAWRIPTDSLEGFAKSQTRLSDSAYTHGRFYPNSPSCWCTVIL